MGARWVQVLLNTPGQCALSASLALHSALFCSHNNVFALLLLFASQKVSHPLHMAAWRTNISELQEQLTKPGADPNKRDKVRPEQTAYNIMYPSI